MKTLFLILIFSFSFLYATIINVPVPYTTIQAGITAAANTDTVLVQPGTYVENINYNGKLITVGSLFLTTQDTTYIASTIIDGNSSDSVVIFNSGEDSTAVLSGFTLTNGFSANFGGGIFCVSSSPSLRNVIITGNSASECGGGICCFGSNPIITACTISGNTAFVLLGGGIQANFYSNLIVQNCTISDNVASRGGGGVHVDGNSTIIFDDCTISYNTVSLDERKGGGIFLEGSSSSLHRCTILGNEADYGGGVYIDSGVVDFDHCTISENVVGLNPNAAIYNDGGTLSITNSILWNDFPDEIVGSASISYSDIEGGWGGTGNIDSDPLFVNPAGGDYHLRLLSPCIDAGDPASPLDPDGTRADMGAYYYDQILHPIPPAYGGPVWHISTTGSDVWGNGSEQYPFATIQFGIYVSSHTDTVLVHPGTYVENINYNGKLITVGSMFLTTQDTTYISSTIIDGNSSSSVVIFNCGEDSTTVLCGLTLTNGSAGSGGGIFFDNYSSPSLENVTISGNTAAYGGGIYCFDSSPSLQNVTTTGNSCSQDGGGIYCMGPSSPIIQNVTISGNTAAYGGGICCYGSSPSLQNVTTTGNSCSQVGGGIYCFNNSSPIIINSILWNDSPQEIYIESGTVTATYSDIQDGWTGTGNIDSDPLFVNPVGGDYHLSWSNYPIPDSTMSPCIDAGDPASSLDPDGTIADMGAFYFDQLIAPDPPQNVTIETIGSDVYLSWDAVAGATSYKVYSSDDPYTGFVEDTSGSFAGESWSTSVINEKKFYYVTAIN